MDRQRIDKWLWHARVVRARSGAAALVDAGLVRVNSVRAEGSSKPVRPGDVVTIALDRQVRVLKVKGFAERRGSAEAASELFDDLTPQKPAQLPPVVERDEGAGRPTKRDRREIDRLQGLEDWDG
jgi:ribosome-associated heat shock protein Hsp15